MSAGGLAGMFMNMFLAAFLWTVLGAVVDTFGNAFNNSLTQIPMLQDAVTAFSVLSFGWVAIMVIIFIALLINYFVNEASLASGEV